MTAVHAQGILLFTALAAAGYWDARTLTIPPAIPVLIFLTGFVAPKFPDGLLAMALMFLFFLPLVIMNGIGGGDMKLLASCGFVLGTAGVLAGAFLGFFIYLLMRFLLYRDSPLRRLGKRAGPPLAKQPHALAPYLGAGCMVAFILQC